MKIFYISIVAISLIVLTACTKDIGPNPDLIIKQLNVPCDSVTFTNDIKPIFDNNCAGCHSPAGGQIPHLSDYNLIKAQADNGRIQARAIDGPAYMPATGRLPDDQINLIKCWLDAGAPNN